MDVLTHFFIPFTAALFVLGLHRRPPQGVADKARRETHVACAVVFGLAGLAPDIDSAFAWLRHHDGWYWLQHRGITHTVLFAPLTGLLGLVLLHGLAARWPARFGRYRFRLVFVPVAILGAWSHLALDTVTYTGIPWLWPFSMGRLNFPIFHYIVLWMFPAVLVILFLHVRRTLAVHQVAWLGAVLIVAMLVLAGARVHYRPDVSADEAEFVRAYPRGAFREWTVVRCDAQQEVCSAQLYRDGAPQDLPVAYQTVRQPGTDEAVAQARATSSYRGFLMGAFGPIITEATVIDPTNGTVQVVFTDVAAHFEAAHEPRWTPAEPKEAWGYVVFHITGRAVEVVHDGW